MNKFIGFLICCLLVGMTWACDDDDEVKSDGVPTVSLGSGMFKTLENVTPFRIPVALSVPATQSVTVTGFVKSETGAKEGVDYRFVSREIVIPAGKSSGYFEVEVTDYPTYRPDRVFEFEVVGAKGAKLATPDVCRVTILSNEGQPVLGFASTLEFVGEEMQQLDIAVETDREWKEDVPFRLRILPDKSTAVYGEHYTVDTTRLYTIPAGSTSVTIPVTIVDNIELNEDFYFELEIYGNEQSVLSEVYGNMKITITDDEEPVYVCFERTSMSAVESEGPVWVPVRVKGNSRLPVKVTLDIRGGTAVEGTDFTFEQRELELPAGTFLDSVRIDFIDNEVYDLDRNLIVGFSSVEGAVLNVADTLAEVKIMNDDFDFEQLYEQLMGEWTLTTTQKTFTVQVSGGDTPAEEDENYLKRLIITVNGLGNSGKTSKIAIDYDVKTGEMSVPMFYAVIVDASVAGWASQVYGNHFDNVLFLHNGSSYMDTEKVELHWNKSYTSCSWDTGGNTIRGVLCPTGTIDRVSWGNVVDFAMSNVVMTRNN